MLLVPVARAKGKGGRPPKGPIPADVRQYTSFHLHGALYNRMKAYLQAQELSQTEWIEHLIRTELARRGF